MEMTQGEIGEKVRHIIARAPHETDLKFPVALKLVTFLLSARVYGSGNEHDKE